MSDNAVASMVQEELAAVSPATPTADQLIAEAAGTELPPPTSPAAPPPPPPPTIEDPKNFDPRIHQVDRRTGKPVITSDGKLRKKAGVKPRTIIPDPQPTAAAAPPPGPAPDPAPAPVVDDVQAELAARNLVNLIITIGITVGGPEFAPQKQNEHPMGVDEKDFLVETWKDYFIATRCIQLPPWVMVLVAMGMYVMPRWQNPVVQERIKNFGKKPAAQIAGGSAPSPTVKMPSAQVVRNN